MNYQDASAIERMRKVIQDNGVRNNIAVKRSLLDPLLLQVENSMVGMELTRPVSTYGGTSQCTQCWNMCCFASYSPGSIKGGTCIEKISKANVVSFH